MRIEYQLGLTLVSSFVIVSVAFLFKLALLPKELPSTHPNPLTFHIEEMSEPSSAEHQKYSMSMQEYSKLYKESLDDPNTFWGQVAHKHLSWIKPFSRVYEPGKDNPFDGFKWFSDGTLNACYNAVDRHAAVNPDKVAVIWEPDDSSKEKSQSITYGELLNNIQKVASYLKSAGVTKGDRVTIYMPPIPETLYAMLGCARIGAIHNTVFAGFGWEALQGRINDSDSRILLTANEAKRGGKVIDLKSIVDKALQGCPQVNHVVVFRRSMELMTMMLQGRDVWWEDSIAKAHARCPVEEMNAEDPLFILYTSGSTGKPKALLHTTGGFLTYASYTFKTIFDYSPEDVYFCTADFGWITGHSYVAYGPLLNSGTIVIFEGVPTYPSPSRLWQIINTHKVNQLYTAPTLLRALKRLGDGHVLDCPSLKLLGSVGEPIDPKTWTWYHDVVGRGRCSIADTYWQTETGGHVICTIPGTDSLIPGYAGLPFMGIELEISTQSNAMSGALLFKRPWPGMARTIYGDHERYRTTYLADFPGAYFTGDGASVDSAGNVRIHGRIDDVINVSAHRLATAEIEAALTKHPGCAEAAVLGKPDELTGQAIAAFCLIKQDHPGSDNQEKLMKELKDQVRSSLGPIASPKYIFFPSDLPKTRSGKIMRRVLRKILNDEVDLGDVSTLTDPGIIEEIRQLVNK